MRKFIKWRRVPCRDNLKVGVLCVLAANRCDRAWGQITTDTTLGAESSVFLISAKLIDMRWHNNVQFSAWTAFYSFITIRDTYCKKVVGG